MIIITGAAGFVGSNITKVLMKNYEVLAVDDLSFGDIRNLPGGVDFLKTDFSELFHDGSSRDDILIHCATSNIIYAINNPVKTMQNNGVNSMELFLRFKGKIIYTSTSSVYGNASQYPTSENAKLRPYNAYDVSKRLAEICLHQRGSYTTLRLTNVYGDNQRPENPYCGVIGKLVDCSINNKIFKITGDINATRDYTYIGDVVKAIQKAVERPAANTEINIGTGDETSIRELIRIIGQLTGRPIEVVQEAPRPIDAISRRCLDVKKAKEILDWSPETHIGGGLIRAINWYKDAYYLTKV